jgi:hypothetical protein
LLLRFFPGGDWRQTPSWAGFGRYRSLAICFELLGQFDDALAAYRPVDAPLGGDALLALGRLAPLLERPQADRAWQVLWQAYRAHALCLAGRLAEAVNLSRSLVPVDVYEWVHVFECLLRAGHLHALDLQSMLYRPPHAHDQRWDEMARLRMRADYLRATGTQSGEDVSAIYETVIDAYDRGGLPFERALSRLGQVHWLIAKGRLQDAGAVNAVTLELARRHQMKIVEADAWALGADIANGMGQESTARAARAETAGLREEVGYRGPVRP